VVWQGRRGDPSPYADWADCGRTGWRWFASGRKDGHFRRPYAVAVTPVVRFAPGTPDRPRAHWSALRLLTLGFALSLVGIAHRLRQVGQPGSRHWPTLAFSTRVGLQRRVILHAVYLTSPFAKTRKRGYLGQARPVKSLKVGRPPRLSGRSARRLTSAFLSRAKKSKRGKV
jgi:hypothetical protein